MGQDSMLAYKSVPSSSRSFMWDINSRPTATVNKDSKEVQLILAFFDLTSLALSQRNYNLGENFTFPSNTDHFFNFIHTFSSYVYLGLKKMILVF